MWDHPCSRQPAAHAALKYPAKKGQQVGAMLRGELMRIFRAEHQKAGQATSTKIKAQTSLRTQIGGAVAVDARRPCLNLAQSHAAIAAIGAAL